MSLKEMLLVDVERICVIRDIVQWVEEGRGEVDFTRGNELLGSCTWVIPKVMSNFFLYANWEQQTKESAVVDGTRRCVILECLVTSIACIT